MQCVVLSGKPINEPIEQYALPICVVLSGKPINEPIEQYGPFVMTTRSELQQTIRDYQDGKNGFENAATWNSSIAELAYQ
ncbi:hypothetical protein THRCLA_21629, partial [Thraustotheca clavata]